MRRIPAFAALLPPPPRMRCVRAFVPTTTDGLATAPGDTFEVVEEGADWVMVKGAADGAKGWVPREHLEAEAVE